MEDKNRKMKIHIYHTGLAVFRDTPFSTKNRRKPKNLFLWPKEPGKKDINFKPWMNDLQKDGQTKQLIKIFEHIDLMDTNNSPIILRRDWIAEKLGISRDELEALLAKLHEMRLLDALTIEFDHRKWLRHAETKGCLVVMVCIEEKDYERDNIEQLATDTITKAYHDLFGVEIQLKKKIKKIFVIPNAHLSSDIGTDHKRNLKILNRIVNNLKKLGFDVALNSYGYAKDIELAIIGHPQEYVLRCV
ncbi:MAG: hypothetical protein AEth_01739 [Candidatus Argoarchaeum ethanivorans]|uniref:Threonyl-tRNA synthetase editing domain-containing protein n=1 Tax=Candidatus Argoarchaeum ethanivorans TaxID=2608793 RepID=A0A8B3S0P0_9EURY|nr:MAG: hypothetical protein AEth_01739 [Candidatus Argoarchaeum ethanivorans]